MGIILSTNLTEGFEQGEICFEARQVFGFTCVGKVLVGCSQLSWNGAEERFFPVFVSRSSKAKAKANHQEEKDSWQIHQYQWPRDWGWSCSGKGFSFTPCSFITMNTCWELKLYYINSYPPASCKIQVIFPSFLPCHTFFSSSFFFFSFSPGTDFEIQKPRRNHTDQLWNNRFGAERLPQNDVYPWYVLHVRAASSLWHYWKFLKEFKSGQCSFCIHQLHCWWIRTANIAASHFACLL